MSGKITVCLWLMTNAVNIAAIRALLHFNRVVILGFSYYDLVAELETVAKYFPPLAAD